MPYEAGCWLPAADLGWLQMVMIDQNEGFTVQAPEQLTKAELALPTETLEDRMWHAF